MRPVSRSHYLSELPQVSATFRGLPKRPAGGVTRLPHDLTPAFAFELERANPSESTRWEEWQGFISESQSHFPDASSRLGPPRRFGRFPSSWRDADFAGL